MDAAGMRILEPVRAAVEKFSDPCKYQAWHLQGNLPPVASQAPGLEHDGLGECSQEMTLMFLRR